MTEQAVKDFWDAQAIKHGAADAATAPDRAYRELEIKAIIPRIVGPWVCDIGCGNGYSTFRFKEAHPDIKFIGVDYSREMIKAASVEAIIRHSDIPFVAGDVRTLSNLGLAKFDTIISERCLINLPTWDEQKKALLEMRDCLVPGGRIVLVENFVDGLDNLNKLRKQFGLHEIKVRWHNRYLSYNEFSSFIDEHFVTEYFQNIGNLYYIVSRVVYAAICKENGTEPQYENPINYIAAKLPSLGSYDYSPNMLYVLRTR